MREESGERQKGEIKVASLESEEIHMGDTQGWDDMGSKVS